MFYGDGEALVGLLQPIIALFKQIGSTETVSRCSRAPPERIKTDLEKYNRRSPAPLELCSRLPLLGSLQSVLWKASVK